MTAECETLVEGPCAVLDKEFVLFGYGGLKEGFVLALVQRWPLEEGNRLVQDVEITCDLDVVGDNIR